MKHKVSQEREREIVAVLSRGSWRTATMVRHLAGGTTHSVWSDLVELRRHSRVISNRYGQVTRWSLPE